MMLYIGMRNWSLFPAAAGLLFFSELSSPQAPARVRVTPSADHVTIGDRVTLEFTIDHAGDATVIWPDSLLNIAPFEQMTMPVTSSSPVNGEVARSVGHYAVAAFEVGDLEFPPVPFDIVGPSGDTTTVTSEALPIVIATVGLEGSDDIRGIKPPLDIPLSWIVIALWLGAASALLVAAWFLYRRLTRRDRPVIPKRAAAPPQPPHVVAYEALDRLERSSVLENQEIQHWYSEVSRIIRVYIEGRYGVHAMEMASSDIMRGLEPLQLEYRALDQFRDFFERADLVKFAKHRPSVQVCRSLLESARKLVDVTRVHDADETADESATGTATAA